MDESATVEVTGHISDERQAMLDMVAHDIATPIATAKGSVHLLRQSMEDMTKEQVDSLLAALDRSIAGIERIAKNLSVDARLGANNFTESFVEISVAQLLGELEQDLMTLAQQKQIPLIFEIQPNAPDSFLGALFLSRQAIENLITNAIKFSPSAETVVVRARPDAESVRFEVTDHGPGVPPEEQHLLFERFTRSQEASRKKLPGLGLGLSIVNRVAEVHGGASGVESSAGGSTFWISFPVENWRPAA
jgi:signal transduction histidine kinase